MAINLKNFETIDTNIKQHKKEKNKFLFDFREGNKRFRKVVIIDGSFTWDKREWRRQIQEHFNKEKILIIKEASTRKGTIEQIQINKNLKVNELMDIYIKLLPDNKWTKTKKSFYNRYLKEDIGEKRIEDLQEHHVMQIIAKMQKNNMKTRTINTILELLKPAFDFAVRHDAILKNPVQFIKLKKENTKKIVTNASEKFKKIFYGINGYYKDEPFYRALFLFGFTGRRKGEILNIKWENIDLVHGYYWIEDTKNNEKQKIEMPLFIKEALDSIPTQKQGLVFKSPITGEKIKNIDRQMNNLKNYLQMPELTLHYMRNILVSALSEQGVEAISLSAILGHRDVTTINKYLSQNYHKSSKEGLEKINKIISVDI